MKPIGAAYRVVSIREMIMEIKQVRPTSAMDQIQVMALHTTLALSLIFLLK